LYSISYELDQNLGENINILKKKKHFNNVDWPGLKKDLLFSDLRKKLKWFKNLDLTK
jgi:hypothetical protein